jgi:acrylyl-CoA reductase (NADPH)
LPSGRNSHLLQYLGVNRVIARSEFEEPVLTLEKQLWAGKTDTIGSNILAKVIAQINCNFAMVACGSANGFYLPRTVMPFILRGAKLLGIDSIYCHYGKDVEACQRLTALLLGELYQQTC